jgi:hypothetical protein
MPAGEIVLVWEQCGIGNEKWELEEQEEVTVKQVMEKSGQEEMTLKLPPLNKRELPLYRGLPLDSW